MAWKRAQEGWLFVDNSFAVRNSPNPYPTETDLLRARARGYAFDGMQVPVYESATATCSHCNAQVILRPDRTRAREYCAKCDAYLCDGCGFRRKHGAACVPMLQRIETIQERAARGLVIAGRT